MALEEGSTHAHTHTRRATGSNTDTHIHSRFRIDCSRTYYQFFGKATVGPSQQDDYRIDDVRAQRFQSNKHVDTTCMCVIRLRLPNKREMGVGEKQ